jgi:hypothetical protein
VLTPYFAPTYFDTPYFGWLDSSSPPITFSGAPDPLETIWSLGFGGAPWDRMVVPGFALLLSTTLKNNDEPVGFTSGATLDATVWPGGSEASVFAPTVAWDTANGGYAIGALTLSITSTQASMLKAGDYRLQLGVTTSGVRSIAYDGSLRVSDTIGTVALRSLYITVADLKILWDQVDVVANRNSDTAGFTTVLAYVCDDFDRKIVKRFCPYPGDIRTRQNTPDPYVGLDVSNPTATWPNKATITNALAAGGLIVDRCAWDILVRCALAVILGRQGPGDNAKVAAMMRAEAEEKWYCYQAIVSFASPPTSTADALIDYGAILLPSGTAP